MMPAAMLTLTHRKAAHLLRLQHACVGELGCSFLEAIVASPVEGHEVGRHDTWDRPTNLGVSISRLHPELQLEVASLAWQGWHEALCKASMVHVAGLQTCAGRGSRLLPQSWLQVEPGTLPSFVI